MINEAIDLADPQYTLQSLLSPKAKLDNVSDANALIYQMVLSRAKLDKTKVNTRMSP